jgi:BirA family biotin operon repressor/biotin-[acetyl-CoA-carboxylase] ligase
MSDSGYSLPGDLCSIGGQLIHLKSVASTNDYAWNLALEGAKHGLVVVADQQTGGRGRLGRSWLSPPGMNLAFSLILRPSLPPQDVPPLSLIAAVALFSFLSVVIPRLSIKWPNDLYCGDRKLAGILSEMKLCGRETDFVIIGIGVNVNSQEDDWPPELRSTAISMRQAVGKTFDLRELLQKFLPFFHSWYERYLSHGFHGQIQQILGTNSYLFGKRVTIAINGRTIQGKAGNIDEYGRLLVYDDREICWPVVAGEATVMDMGDLEKRGDANDSCG